MLALPSNIGYSLVWYTGETRPKTRKKADGTREKVGDIRIKASFESTSKELIEKKLLWLTENGFEIVGVYDCVF